MIRPSSTSLSRSIRMDGTLMILVESGYPTEGIRDAFLRDGAAQRLGFFAISLRRRTAEPDEHGGNRGQRRPNAH